MVMAGGTGGHVFPGLAVAHHLMDQGWQVRWLGTADRMEADLVPKHGIDIDFIRISGLRGKGLKAQLLAPVRIFNAWRQARAIMKRFQPDVVLGMGGYVSGPGGLAAWSLGIPVVLHEQNGIAGLTNKWLAKIAKKVMQAFPGAFPHADVVGNPVRTDVLALPLPGQRLVGRQGPIRVLVVGGSQGARVLNQTMPQVAAKLGDAVTIWHQSGKGGMDTVRQAYAAAGQPQHKVTEFIDDMAAAYAGRCGCLSFRCADGQRNRRRRFTGIVRPVPAQRSSAVLECAAAGKSRRGENSRTTRVHGGCCGGHHGRLGSGNPDGYGGTSAWRFDSGCYRAGSGRGQRRSFGALIAVIFTARIKKLMA